MTEVWDGVIGTSVMSKEVGAFGWLALVPCQRSGCKGGWVSNFIGCCFLSVTRAFLLTKIYNVWNSSN